jgi:hypothetical protein
MPEWAGGVTGWIITAAAVTTALIVLFKKVVLPGYKGVGAIEDALPVLRDFTATFKGRTDVFGVLDSIAAQFRTDSGSSLRDSVDDLISAAQAAVAAAETNRLVAERAAEENRRANESLMIRFEAQRQLVEQRSQQQERMLLQIDRVMVQIGELTASGGRIEASRAKVAEDLVVRERKVDEAASGVAADLAASQQRAEPEDEAGSGADAAQTAEDE